MTEETFTAVEVACVGRRVLQSGKLGEAYILVTTLAGCQGDMFDQLVERVSSIFELSKKMSSLIVGGIYTMECLIEGDRIIKARISGRKFERMVEPALAAKWDCIDMAERTRLKARKQEKSLSANHAVMRDIQAIRAYYHSASYEQRPAIEMSILTLIRKK